MTRTVVVLILAFLFVLSSIVAASVTAERPRTSYALARALSRALEFVGLWTVCLLLNLGLGTVFILSLRAVTPAFVSIYVLDDISIVLVSAVQAFVLHAWISSSRGDGAIK